MMHSLRLGESFSKISAREGVDAAPNSVDEGTGGQQLIIHDRATPHDADQRQKNDIELLMSQKNALEKELKVSRDQVICVEKRADGWHK